MMRWERFFRLTAVLLFAATVMVGFQVQWVEARGYEANKATVTREAREAATSFSDLV